MDFEKLHQHHRYHRIATYAIVGFLVVLSGGVIFLSSQTQSSQLAEIRSRAAENTGGVQNQGLSQGEADGEGPIFESEEEALSAGVASYQKPDTSFARSYLNQYEHKIVEPTGKVTVSPTKKPKKNPEAGVSYKVYPILFVAKDKRANSKNNSAINEAMQLVKRWYSGPLQKSASSGYTFDVTGSTTVRAAEVFDYYKCWDHTYPCSNYDGLSPNVREELKNKGYGLGEEGNIYLIFVVGAGGYAGANCYGGNCNTSPGGGTSTSGYAIMGDWALDAISGTVNRECAGYYDRDFCGKSAQTGTIGHELGHAFGLEHPDGDPNEGDTIMSWAFADFPFVSLINTGAYPERNILWPSKFFHSIGCSDAPRNRKTVMKKNVSVGQAFNTIFDELNYGYCAWNKQNTKLVLTRDNVWGTTEILMDDTLYPAQNYEFWGYLVAPLTAGKYGSFWGLQKSGRLFGGKLGRRVTVIANQGPTITPTPSTTQVTPSASPTPGVNPSVTPLPSITATAHQAVGSIVSSNCSTVVGWACDPDNFSEAMHVGFFNENNIAESYQMAGGVAPDAIKNACGGYANHGFTFTVPQSMKDGGTHTISVKVRDIPVVPNGPYTSYQGNSSIVLAGCVKPTPTSTQ